MTLSEWPEIEAICGQNKRPELEIKGPLNRSENLDNEKLQKQAFYEGVSVNFVSLTNCNLHILHPVVANCTQLVRLFLFNNSLTSLPEEIGNLSLLKVIDVSSNKLTGLPSSLKSLTKLETLIASHNEIHSEGLFDFMGLVKLHVLDLSHNKLTKIPDGLTSGKLVHLHTANFSYNNISQIEESFSLLSQMKDLNLSSNSLENIPGPLGKLDKVKLLDISNNKFKDSRFAKLSNDKRTKVAAIMTYIKKNASSSKQTVVAEESKEIAKEEKSVHVIIGNEAYYVERLPAAKEIRPYLVCCVVQNLDISGENFKKFIHIQTKLHASLCGNRTIAAIGTHDLSCFIPPLRYVALPPEELHITALHKKTPVSAKELIEVLLRDAELARKRTKRSTVNPLHKYLHLVENLPLLPCLIDSNGLVISFAPVTNSDTTKLSESTRNVWIEVSSCESLQVCKDIMDQIITETLEFSPDLEIHQVRIRAGEVLVSAYPDKSDLSSIKTDRKTI